MTKTKTKVEGFPPAVCDLCKEPFFNDTAYDGVEKFLGKWCWMCELCFVILGVGLGTGVGQKYVMNAEGKWLKERG